MKRILSPFFWKQIICYEFYDVKHKALNKNTIKTEFILYSPIWHKKTDGF